MTRVLFLWGLSSGPRRVKASYLASVGYEVVEPETMPYPDTLGKMALCMIFPSRFAGCIDKAQDLLDQCRPDIIVGSSFGGAVALNLKADRLPMVLIAPAWRWGIMTMGTAKTVRASAVVLHSPYDRRVKFKHSRKLLKNSEQCLDDRGRSLCNQIGDALREEGYRVEQERLVPIGKNHGCTEPHPQDQRNKNPDPLFALQRTIEILSRLA